MTTCPQCLAAQRDLALAHINHVPKETPMTTTPERLTWTPGDGTEALLAIRDRVKAAQAAGVEMEPMTAHESRPGGTMATITGPPGVDEDDWLHILHGTSVLPEQPSELLTRVEWTPPADPDPAWADADVIAEVDAGDVVGVLRASTHPDGEWWATGHEHPVRTSDVQAEEDFYGHTIIHPLIRTVDGKPRVCAEAILALGVDGHGALYDAWVHNVGRGVWDWLRDLGGDR